MSTVKTASLESFARQLVAWRGHMGLTQEQLGEKIGYSTSLISGVENLEKPPSEPFAKALDGGFGTPGTFEELRKLVAREAYPAFFAPVVGFERDAIRIHGWELGAVPGLLQTESYAHHVIRSGRPNDNGAAIDRLVAARMERQGILTGPRPPMVWYLIDEGVIRHVVGSPEIMGGQLDKLIEAATVPGIVIQALPYNADNNAGADGPITVYEFVEGPTVAYTECYAGGRIVEDRAEVMHLIMVMNLIRASALSQRETLELMQKIRSEL